MEATKQIHVLWSCYSDGTGTAIVRAYETLTRAEQDLALVREDSTKNWYLTDVPVIE